MQNCVNEERTMTKNKTILERLFPDSLVVTFWSSRIDSVTFRVSTQKMCIKQSNCIVARELWMSRFCCETAAAVHDTGHVTVTVTVVCYLVQKIHLCTVYTAVSGQKLSTECGCIHSTQVTRWRIGSKYEFSECFVAFWILMTLLITHCQFENTSVYLIASVTLLPPPPVVALCMNWILIYGFRPAIIVKTKLPSRSTSWISQRCHTAIMLEAKIEI